MSTTTERQYDRLYNEGGSGFNPHSNARLAREDAESQFPEISKLRHELETIDCSVARESGTYNPERVAYIRTRIAQIESDQASAFLVEWTIDVTQKRKSEWNAFVRANTTKKGILATLVTKKQREQGWSMADLKKAIAIHKL